MAGITVHTASPISPNAPPNPLIGSPSKSLVRCTPVKTTPPTITATTSSDPPLPAQPGAAACPQPTTPPRLADAPSPKSIPPPMTGPAQPTRTSLSKLSIPTHTISSPFPYNAPPIPLHQRHPSLHYPPSLHSIPQASVTLPFHTPPTPYDSNHRQDLSHPPGYVQFRGSFDDRPLSACSTPSPNNRAYYLNSDHKSRLSILDGQYHTEKSLDEDDDPISAGSKWIWDTVVKLTKVAGKTLKEGEGEFRRRVNGDMER